ncbi:hypothetical protein AM571_CH00360 [Rhizobium etli 8C-3]|uniref:Uncharacterized protein n=1 Tax=Rhizobium etli 8C-3 TaxID=538025 RepID=A0A1L5NZ75_RHIET|nr:hypothetical protein AM571_CH00360 [Rhizobium etli 8C-3]
MAARAADVFRAINLAGTFDRLMFSKPHLDGHAGMANRANSGRGTNDYGQHRAADPRPARPHLLAKANHNGQVAASSESAGLPATVVVFERCGRTGWSIEFVAAA